MKNIFFLAILLIGYQGYSQDPLLWGNNNSRTEGRDDAGLQGNAGARSGFFETYNPINFPSGASSFWHLLDVRHSNSANNYAMQFSGGFFDQNFYCRKVNNNPAQPWSRILLESADGKVGIGTTSPENAEGWQRVLEVHGDLHSKIMTTTSGIQTGLYADGYNGFYSCPAGEAVGTATNHPFSIVTNKINRVTIGENGLVGIGTTTPQNTLHVDPKGSGGISIGNGFDNGGYTNFLVGISQSSGGYSYLQSIKAAGSVWGDLILNSRGGNVGVGTTSPTEKLAVNGNIRAKKVIVTQSNWADYVFEPSYKLPSLDSIASFIKANKHLPEMPSTSTIEKDGLDVGEMQKLLLKKLEELTLYIISQEDRIKKLEEENRQLKK
ncbi:hypothetical protein [Pinibacter soli]|uniref:Peptidase S74 domain-containing protein n=1 Tax=Pinibacter soli TaxID=3044211 RepID=A0ABT6RFQ8_9BACT|nr:hypothetical protein [Pinibacter soli]MDI3321394.1 hypothetical protein [Pinibacter soli]